MTSKVSIISQAFLLIGENAVDEADIDLGNSTNQKARTAAILYPTIVEELMLQTWWAFARHIQQLTLLSESSDLPDYEYVYELPFLPNRTFMFGFSPKIENYIMIGQKLYTNYKGDSMPLKCLYITKDVTENNFPAYFRIALIYLLAARLAYNVTKDKQLSQEMIALANLKISQATALDAIQEPPPKIFRDSLLEAHYEQTW